MRGADRAQLNVDDAERLTLTASPETIGLAARRPARRGGLDVERVRAAVEPIFDRAAETLGLRKRVHVHATEADLPEALQWGLTDDIVALYDPDTDSVHIIADRVASEDAARRDAVHEIVGHLAMERIVDDWPAMARQVEMMSNTPRGREIMDQVMRAYPDSVLAAMTEEQRRLTRAKEFLAIAAERTANDGPIMRILRRIRAAFRDLVMRLGFRDPFTDGELDSLIAAAERYLRRPHQAAAPAGRALFAAMADPLRTPFVSEMLRHVGELPAKALPAAGWLSAINRLVNLGKVKAAEIEWSGVREWLQLQPGKVRHDDLMGWLRDNRVDVHTTDIGVDNYGEWTQRGADIANYRTTLLTLSMPGVEPYISGEITFPEPRPDEHLPSPMETMDSLIEAMNEEGLGHLPYEITRQPHPRLVYTGWIEPDHRAVRRLIRKHFFMRAHDDHTKYSVRRPYIGGHYRGIPNIIAHVRLTDRTDSDGRRVLFVEEIQGDWGQDARRYGVGPTLSADMRDTQSIDDQLLRLRREERELQDEWWRAAYEWADANRQYPFNFEFSTQGRVLKNLQAERQERIDSEKLRLGALKRGILDDLERPPRGPFIEVTEHWVTLALKQAIRVAVSEGHEAVVLPDGQQMADLYNIDKHVSRIVYYPLDGSLRAYDRYDNRAFWEDNVTPARLSSLVGDELSGRLLDQVEQIDARRRELWRATVEINDDGTYELVDHLGETMRDRNGNLLRFRDRRTAEARLDDIQNLKHEVNYAELTGDGLTIGGHGMRSFYDTMVRSAAKKLLSRLGGRMGRLRVEGLHPEPDGLYHSIEIDPTLEDRARSGFALFARRGPLFARRENDFQAENLRLREMDQSLWTRAGKLVQEQFGPGGLLPRPVHELLIKRDGRINSDEFEIGGYVAQLEAAVVEATGTRLMDLPPKQMKPLMEALSGHVSANIPEPVRKAVYAMRQRIDAMTQQYVGIMQTEIDRLRADRRDEAAEAKIQLMEIMLGNIGRYVHRSYKVFDDEYWYRNVPDEVLANARAYLTAQYADEADPEQRAETAIWHILKEGTAYMDLGSFISEGKLGAKDLSVLIHRKDIAPEIRALLGEYDDIRVNFVKSASKMSRLIWNTTFLNGIREAGYGVFMWDRNDPNKPPEATQELAGPTSSTYSPLNGLYVTPEVAKAFAVAMDRETLTPLYRWAVMVNGMVKAGKVVISPTTQFRNFFSGIVACAANGHFNMTHIVSAIRAMRGKFGTDPHSSVAEYYKRMIRLGVVLDSTFAQELALAIKDANFESTLFDGLLGGGLRATREWLNDAWRFLSKIYQSSDDFWKVVGFENEYESLKAAGFTDADAETEAARRIRNTYPTWSLTGRAIKNLSRNPLVGTYVSFPAEIVRTSGNILGLIKEDLGAGRTEMAMKRAVGASIAAGFSYALTVASMAALGLDDEDDEAARQLSAPWNRNSQRLYLPRDERGDLRFIDLTALDFYAYLKRPIVAVINGDDMRDSVTGFLSEALGPFLGWEIATGAALEVAFNQKLRGGKVYDEHGSVREQAEEIGRHMFRAVGPGIMTNFRGFERALEDYQDKTGKKWSVQDEMFALFGFRATTVDTRNGLVARAYDFLDEKRSASVVMRDFLNDPNPRSDADLDEAIESANRRLRGAYSGLRMVMRAVQDTGLPDRQAFIILRRSGVSIQDIRILRGEEIPTVRVTTEQMLGAIRKARALYDAETVKRIRERYQQILRRQRPP